MSTLDDRQQQAQAGPERVGPPIPGQGPEPGPPTPVQREPILPPQAAHSSDTLPPPTPPYPMEAFSNSSTDQDTPGNTRRRIAIAGTAVGATLLAGAVYFLTGGGARESDNTFAFGPSTTLAEDNAVDPSTTVTTAPPETTTTLQEVEVTPGVIETIQLDGPVSYKAIEARTAAGSGTPMSTFEGPNGELYYVPAILNGDTPEEAVSCFLNGVAAYTLTSDQFAYGPLISPAYEGDTRQENIVRDLDLLRRQIGPSEADAEFSPDRASGQFLFGTGDVAPTFSDNVEPNGNRTVKLEGGELLFYDAVPEDGVGRRWQDWVPNGFEVASPLQVLDLELVLEPRVDPLGVEVENVVAVTMRLVETTTGDEVFRTSNLR